VNQALIEMLRESGEPDRILSSRGLTFTRSEVIEQPPPPGGMKWPPDPPNWDEEWAEREARGRAERVAEAAALL
jgi:hypothetical protein